MLLVFALTLFTSATLLFMVEPMIGKMITPLLGGTPAVWNTCMVFFQAVLLAGYAYAHFSTSWLGPRKQALPHIVLMALPFVFLPVAVNRDLISGSENPVFALLLLLSLTVGVPMFVVSASAPLLQKWFANTSHPAARDPYFLYGASNFGSMLALIGYPTVVEPFLRLRQQSVDWTMGYGMLAALTLACAFFLLRSQRLVDTKGHAGTDPLAELPESEQNVSSAIHSRRYGTPRDKQPQLTLKSGPPPATTLRGDVTWLRVARWVILALVPSSLMLGATTYITTDIAAIPLLWVAPLALYLLSFIIVYSHVPAWLQWLILMLGGGVIVLAAANWLWNMDPTDVRAGVRIFRYMTFPAVGGGAFGGWWMWRNRNTELLYKAMILIMPLLVLAQLFFMLSGLTTKSNWIAWSLCLHLSTLFVVAMVCHGELARDRPTPKHLTSYFLWMSVGGVFGGLFNALAAPMIFSDLSEYPLALMLACFLAPPLGSIKESEWSLRFDLILAGLFVVVGGTLIYLRVVDENVQYELIKKGPWKWLLASLLAIVVFGLAMVLRSGRKKIESWMDLALPLGLALLFVGLSWGLLSEAVYPRVEKLGGLLHLDVKRFITILVYGVPIVLGYTFVERPLRFGLGVGAILLAGGFCDVFSESVTHQERSFFGVLKIADTSFMYRGERFDLRRLYHGTTLHGMQYLSPADRRDQPLSYYHRTGPIGAVMMQYNGEDTPVYKMNLAVIGLGTGTMACYARPGQNLTFYDIDPIVKRFSFDPGDNDPFPFFSYVQDARERGANLDLVMGDARLTMEKKQLKESEKYGVIVVDAFSSDAIPVHLITSEAVKVYLDKMADDGLLCFHISNRYLDLKPVLYNLAREHNLAAVYQNDLRQDDDRTPSLFGKYSSTWVILSRRQERLQKLLDLNDWEDHRTDALLAAWPASLWPDNGTGFAANAMMLRNLLDDEFCKRPSQWLTLEPEKDWPKLESVGVWTDDYSNLLSVFTWR
jgi:hypothetical protein